MDENRIGCDCLCSYHLKNTWVVRTMHVSEIPEAHDDSHMSENFICSTV